MEIHRRFFLWSHLKYYFKNDSHYSNSWILGVIYIEKEPFC